MFIIKFILLVILFFCLLGVVYFIRMIRGIGQQARNFTRQGSEKRSNSTQHTNTTTHTSTQKRKIIPKDEGEYVDFE
ncbi:MAG: DUF4834 family protein [Prevotella sp.]